MHATVDESGKVYEIGSPKELLFRLGEYRWLVKVSSDLTPTVGDELHISWDNQRGEMRAY